MPVIYCAINLFDADQVIYLIEENNQKEIAKTPLDYLDGTLAALCHDKEIYNVHLFGLEDFVIDIANKINKTEELMFSQNRIKVEVNKNEVFN